MIKTVIRDKHSRERVKWTSEDMIELVKVGERVNGAVRELGGDSFVCRVQFLNDLDPFMEYNVREPPRALYHTFNTTIPLSYQIAAVHRLLQAPHRVSPTPSLKVGWFPREDSRGLASEIRP